MVTRQLRATSDARSLRPGWSLWAELSVGVLMGLLWLALLLRLPLDPDVRWEALHLWLIGAVLARLISGQRVQDTLLRGEGRQTMAPFLALALVGLLLLAVGHGPLVVWLVPVHLLWSALGALLNRRAEGAGSPVRLGVVAAARERTLLPSRRLEYVAVSAFDPRRLAYVDGLLLDPQDGDAAEVQSLLAYAHVMNVPVWSRRRLEEELTGKVSLSSVRQEGINRRAFDSGYAPVKRAADLVFTLLAAPLLLPLMAAVAVVVYFNSGRPVLFWQERIGQEGRAFRLVKFRTMTRDSERSGPAFATQGDLRVTPVGALLRKFRLDELPQFWNVLRGEMSIIGPRPEQGVFAAEFEESIPLYATRHWVRPGITGWAQVNQGYTDSMGQTTEKLQYDFYYVKHLSWQLDLLIVWKTVLTILTGFGAR